MPGPGCLLPINIHEILYQFMRQLHEDGSQDCLLHQFSTHHPSPTLDTEIFTFLLSIACLTINPYEALRLFQCAVAGG
ncbi:hypothetical protein EYC84_004820 [Monilinia fructicola]|uniref:Uncharacterized protein n=1 Tax=Monilinia fructicola TaxID=38448 RepID=A0A5M9K4G4_MONFR|nr:hypothetical protein EYC84_004820 [Monilinia fructicola]